MSSAGERPFALVPRRRFVGVRFGQHRSPRRGQGDEVAGTRPYRPGDRPTWIDWPASARLSAARGTDEFVVREFFADTAPLVALAVDRRPRMELYGPPLPWLDKPAASAAAIAAIGRATPRPAASSPTSTSGEGARIGSLQGRRWRCSSASRRAARPIPVPPGRRPLDGCLLALIRHASSFPAGTFVFVVSDFIDAVSPGIWLKLRALRWDVTSRRRPGSDVGAVVPGRRRRPAAGPRCRRPARSARSWSADARRARGRKPTSGASSPCSAVFARLGFDPVVLGSSEPTAIAEGFDRWASRRRRLRRRSA